MQKRLKYYLTFHSLYVNIQTTKEKGYTDMMTCYEKLERIDRENGWFGRLNDFVKCCDEDGLLVSEINSEYACVMDLDDDQDECLVYFGGTERTITIEKIKEA